MGSAVICEHLEKPDASLVDGSRRPRKLEDEGWDITWLRDPVSLACER